MYYIGLDIGGTKCAVSLGKTGTDAQGRDSVALLAKEKFPTGKQTPFEVMDALYAHTEAILKEHSLAFSDLSGIGISCGGPLDATAGVILSPPNLPKWDHIEIVAYFEEKTGVKTYLQNDANACAVAEWKFGAGRGVENMVFLTFGTGLGAGLILNGRLYSGSSDMAGEIGHVRLKEDDGGFLPVGYGKRGSAEGFCSGGGIAELGKAALADALARGETPRLYTEAGENPDNITAKLIGDLADAGDALSLEIYRTCGRRLGQTLSILIDVLNPSLIVLGGVFMRSDHLLRETMEEVINRETIGFASRVCKIVPAGLGETIGDYAALSVATGSY